MGLKLPWFRKQLRFTRSTSTSSEVTGTNFRSREVTARATNVPSQGVFRRWDQDEGPPPVPPSTIPKKEKAPPVPSKKKPTPTEAKSPHTPSERTPSFIPVPPPAPPQPKAKSAPPSRRNPNVANFPVATSAVQSSNYKIPPKSSFIVVDDPIKPPEEVFNLVSKNGATAHLGLPTNGHAVPLRSPVPTLKGPLRPRQKGGKKGGGGKRMAPVARPEVPRVTRDDDDLGDGTLTFRVPNEAMQRPQQNMGTFFTGGVEDSEECDA